MTQVGRNPRLFGKPQAALGWVSMHLSLTLRRTRRSVGRTTMLQSLDRLIQMRRRAAEQVRTARGVASVVTRALVHTGDPVPLQGLSAPQRSRRPLGATR